MSSDMFEYRHKDKPKTATVYRTNKTKSVPIVRNRDGTYFTSSLTMESVERRLTKKPLRWTESAFRTC
ncbi:hypothetical protein D3C76_730320 [compost metagenome]